MFGHTHIYIDNLLLYVGTTFELVEKLRKISAIFQETDLKLKPVKMQSSCKISTALGEYYENIE